MSDDEATRRIIAELDKLTEDLKLVKGPPHLLESDYSHFCNNVTAG